MDLFTYLMAKNGNNSSVHGDLFSYLLGKGQSQTQTVSGVTIYIPDAKKLVSFMMTKESTQDGEPTPDNPVPVNVVKGYENLFDKNNVQWYRNNNSAFINTLNYSTTRIRTTSFSITGGKTYTVSGIPSEVTFNGIRTYEEYGGENTTDFTKTGNTITLGANVKYIHLLFNGSNFTDETNELMANANIQIVEGEQELPYVPYGNNYIAVNISDGTNTNQVPLPLNGNEIVGSGKYKDELIVDKSGHCWLNKLTGKVVLDGTEKWEGRPNYTYADRFLFGPTPNIPLQSVKCFSNYFKVENAVVTDFPTLILNNGQQLIINFSEKGTTTLSQFKAWLSTHNTEVYYALKTPQLIDLNTTVDLKLFKGVNNISNSEDGYMTIEYR